MLSAFSSLGQILLDVLFPRICCGCDERILEKGRIVCKDCERAMRPLQLPLCPRCGEEDSQAAAAGKCPSCPRGTIYFEAARAATVYEGPALQILERLKYRARSEYAEVIIPFLTRAAKQYYDNIKIDSVVPVPLHRTRQRERGYNQSELLARGLGTALAIPVIPNMLRRVRHTPSQTHLDRRERAENVKGAFVAVNPATVGNKVILLIDDVYTTGATLNECARVLRHAGADAIYALSFCRAELSS
ncbi:MAG: ComF family protein [Candidatus Sumerlaeaceae bacterium]|nr:ComF family protein [Candidatus Sumerlaeaceae bacterium]